MKQIFVTLIFLILGSFAFSAERGFQDDKTKVMEFGYGNERIELNASSSSVVTAEDLLPFKGRSLSSALVGLCSGLICEEHSASMGNTLTNLLVRGRSTLGVASNSPLVLVDGFERGIDDVPIEDVESVTVIKDASTALFGIRGANGVILVATKRGNVSRINISVSYDQAFKTPYRIPEFVSSADFLTMYNQALEYDNLKSEYTEQNIDGFRKGNSLQYPDIRWEKELLKDMGYQSYANIHADGGSEYARYFVSLGYEHETGIFNSNYSRNERDYSVNEKSNKVFFRTNLDLIALKNFNVRVDLGGSIMMCNYPGLGAASLYDAIYRTPQYEFPVFVADGLYGGSSNYSTNPVAALNENGYERAEHRMVNSGIELKYNFQGALKGLAVGAKYNYDNFYNVTEFYRKSYRVGLVSKDENGVLRMKPDGSGLVIGGVLGADTPMTYRTGRDSQRRISSLDIYLNYDKYFNIRHHLNALVFYQQARERLGPESPYCYQAINGRLVYDYDERFIANLILSYSGSEAFARGNRFTFNPAVSFAWVLNNEGFMKDNRNVNLLKLRLSAGRSSNSDFGNRFIYRQKYTGYGSYVFGSTLKTYYGITEDVLANPDLTAEKSFKTDAGLDMRLFKALDLNATYFFEHRYDILVNQGNVISSVVGARFPYVNSGSSDSYGVELSIGSHKQFHDWGIRSRLNFTWYKNRIVDIIDSPLPENSSYQYRRGSAIGSQLLLVSDGFFGSQEEIDNSPLQQYGHVMPGDLKYRDINCDGLVNDYDRVWSDAYQNPNKDLSFFLGFNFHDFDFSAYMTFQGGNAIDLGAAPLLFRPFYNGGRRITTYVADRHPWTPENAQNADYPRLTTMDNSNNYRPSTFWQMKGDIFRIRYVELGYNFMERLKKTHFIRDFRLYLRADNLFTASKLDFVDPIAMGGELVMRACHVGLSLKF